MVHPHQLYAESLFARMGLTQCCRALTCFSNKQILGLSGRFGRAGASIQESAAAFVGGEGLEEEDEEGGGGGRGRGGAYGGGSTSERRPSGQSRRVSGSGTWESGVTLS